MTAVPEQRPSSHDQLSDSHPISTEASPPPVAKDTTVVLKPVFREFSIDDFSDNSTWNRLAPILKGNGGSYGLYGPRGSGKSWLMMRAKYEADQGQGIGLWFPCPRRYDSRAFLSELSGKLVDEIERRFAKDSLITLALRRGQTLLLYLLAILIIIGLTIYALRELALARTHSAARELANTLPDWLWPSVGVTVTILVVLNLLRFRRDNSPNGRLLQEALALRERIRYTAGLRLGSEISVSGSRSLIATFRRSREKSLEERPSTIASLVSDFRNLAEQVAARLPGPLVIGVDELDKIENTASVRGLLRDIKGIFEVTGVHFLVSISEEAATTLQLGPLQSTARNEFNSSFYTVIELPPLDPRGAVKLLGTRGLGNSDRLAEALCVLSGGNRRELVRMADLCAFSVDQSDLPLDERAIITLLEAESLALLQEIIRDITNNGSITEQNDPKYGAWIALPREQFSSIEKFVRLGESAIRNYWTPHWADADPKDELAHKQEPWRRLLVRLFVAAKLLSSPGHSGAPDLLNDDSALINLRDILLMATNDAGVALHMLASWFRAELPEPYRHTPPSLGP